MLWRSVRGGATGQGAARHSHCGLRQILCHGPAACGRVILLDSRIVMLLHLVPGSLQEQLLGQWGQAGGAHAEEERGGQAPCTTQWREDLHKEHIHLLTAKPVSVLPPPTPSLWGWRSSASRGVSHVTLQRVHGPAQAPPVCLTHRILGDKKIWGRLDIFVELFN